MSFSRSAHARCVLCIPVRSRSWHRPEWRHRRRRGITNARRGAESEAAGVAVAAGQAAIVRMLGLHERPARGAGRCQIARTTRCLRGCALGAFERAGRRLRQLLAWCGRIDRDERRRREGSARVSLHLPALPRRSDNRGGGDGQPAGVPTPRGRCIRLAPVPSADTACSGAVGSVSPNRGTSARDRPPLVPGRITARRVAAPWPSGITPRQRSACAGPPSAPVHGVRRGYPRRA